MWNEELHALQQVYQQRPQQAPKRMPYSKSPQPLNPEALAGQVCHKATLAEDPRERQKLKKLLKRSIVLQHLIKQKVLLTNLPVLSLICELAKEESIPNPAHIATYLGANETLGVLFKYIPESFYQVSKFGHGIGEIAVRHGHLETSKLLTELMHTRIKREVSYFPTSTSASAPENPYHFYYNLWKEQNAQSTLQERARRAINRGRKASGDSIESAESIQLQDDCFSVSPSSSFLSFSEPEDARMSNLPTWSQQQTEPFQSFALSQFNPEFQNDQHSFQDFQEIAQAANNPYRFNQSASAPLRPSYGAPLNTRQHAMPVEGRYQNSFQHNSFPQNSFQRNTAYGYSDAQVFFSEAPQYCANNQGSPASSSFSSSRQQFLRPKQQTEATKSQVSSRNLTERRARLASQKERRKAEFLERVRS